MVTRRRKRWVGNTRNGDFQHWPFRIFTVFRVIEGVFQIAQIWRDEKPLSELLGGQAIHLGQSPQGQMKFRHIALGPDLIEVQTETGRYYYHCELNYPKALQILEKLKSDYPKNGQLHSWAGLVYKRMGQFQKAFEYQDRAISLNPSAWGEWIDAGLTLAMLGRYRQAEDYIKTHCVFSPKNK